MASVTTFRSLIEVALAGLSNFLPQALLLSLALAPHEAPLRFRTPNDWLGRL
jgi:hypothetical protein